MAGKRSEVGKVFVKVRREGKLFHLFSKKNSPGREKHNHLELLGGRIEDEDFMAGTIRELKEEETTGLLAGKLSGQRPSRRVEIDGRLHHIFEIQIEFDEYEGLKHNPDESLGFVLVPESELKEKKFQPSLTKQTRKIFEALGLRA